MNDLESVRVRLKRLGDPWQAKPTNIGELIQTNAFLGLGLAVGSIRPLAGAQPPSPALSMTVLPQKLDWREPEFGGVLTDVRNQGSCGSCVAFAVVAAMESQLLLRDTVLGDAATLDLSEAHLFNCGAGASCEGGWTYAKAFKQARATGVGLERDLPYDAGDRTCRNIPSVSRLKKTIKLNSDYERKLALSSRGPLLASMQVYADFGWYGGGVYAPTTSDVVGGHAVCVVGYDDDELCWLIKNSWGRSWGEDGYARIRYGSSSIDAWPFHAVELA